MNKPPTDPSDNVFKILAKIIATISKDRSDTVAITGIVGMVLAFMTLIFAVTGFASHNPPPANPPTQQSSPQKPN